jgi:hypothetical protein
MRMARFTVAQSARSAAIGSTFVARTAGSRDANAHAATSATTTTASVVGSAGDTSKTRPRSARVSANAPATPATTPSAAILKLSATIMRTTVTRDAPSATRTPLLPERRIPADVLDRRLEIQARATWKSGGGRARRTARLRVARPGRTSLTPCARDALARLLDRRGDQARPTKGRFRSRAALRWLRRSSEDARRAPRNGCLLSRTKGEGPAKVVPQIRKQARAVSRSCS